MKMFFYLILLYKISFSIEFPFELYTSPLLFKILNNTNDTNVTRKDIANPDDPEMVGKLLTTVLIEILSKLIEDIQKKNDKYNNSCISYMQNLVSDSKNYANSYNESYIKENKFKSREGILKFLLDSSKSRNELNYYKNCLDDTRTYSNYDKTVNKYSYLVVIINTPSQSNDNNDNNTRSEFRLDYEEHFYLKGYCVPLIETCIKDDYENIIYTLNEKYNFFFFPNNSNVTVYFMNNSENKEINEKGISITFLVIVCIFIGLVLFHYPIFILLKICFKKRINIINENNEVNIEKKENNKYYIPKWLIKLNSCFSFNENLEELFNLSTNSTNVNNYSGLMEIRGLNAISMSLSLFGFTFIAIYNSPMKTSGISQIFKVLEHYLYFLIFIGIRFSPRIVLSCSGYSLIYKYLSYIDKYNKNYSVLKFIFYQSHKFFIFIVLLLFFRYSLNFLFIELVGNLPIWKFMVEKIIKNKDYMGFLKYLVGIQGLIEQKPSNQKTASSEQNLNYYLWLPFNEIIFFIVGVSLITIGYKFKLRIDIFIIILIFLIYIGKIIISLIREEYNPLLYYYTFNYGTFMTSAFFNFPSFCIGLYFGLINYALQKGAANKFDISISSRINTFSFLKKEKTKKNNSLFEDNEDDNNNKKEENKDEDSNDDSDELKDNDNDNDKDNDNDNDDNNIDTKDDDNNNNTKENIINNSKNNTIINNEEDKNALIQKKNLAIEKNMPFLKSSIGFINYQKKVKCNILFYILISTLILTPYIIHWCFLYYYNNEIEALKKQKHEGLERVEHMEKYYNALNIEEFMTNKFLKILYNMDIEIIVFLIHWLFFILHISGKSNILSFFTSIKWGIFNKSYFSFIIVSNMIILFSIYSNESVISINIFTIYLYFIFDSINAVICVSFCYIFLELPLKKLVKLILCLHEDENDNEDDNDNDNKENNIEKKDSSNL